MKKIFSGNKQPSDTFRLTFLLSIVGGLLDAYTFLVRGKVLANAQTGNIVYLAIYLGERNIKKKKQLDEKASLYITDTLQQYFLFLGL